MNQTFSDIMKRFNKEVSSSIGPFKLYWPNIENMVLALLSFWSFV